MAEPGRGKVLYPSKHRIRVNQTDGDRWGWAILAPVPDNRVLLVGTRTYIRVKDAMRQAGIDFDRHKVDILLLTKHLPAGTTGPRYGTDVSPFHR